MHAVVVVVVVMAVAVAVAAVMAVATVVLVAGGVWYNNGLCAVFGFVRQGIAILYHIGEPHTHLGSSRA